MLIPFVYLFPVSGLRGHGDRVVIVAEAADNQVPGPCGAVVVEIVVSVVNVFRLQVLVQEGKQLFLLLPGEAHVLLFDPSSFRCVFRQHLLHGVHGHAVVGEAKDKP